MGGGIEIRYFYKYTILLLFFLIIGNKSFSQEQKYSIDNKSFKSRRVSVSYFLKTSLKEFKDYQKRKKEKRIENKLSKKIRKHIYSIQSKHVKKRMKRAKRKAYNYNNRKIPCIVKLKKLF